MLNTNQSKKRNSWKYYVVIPVLAAFVLLFQVEVIAKEKSKIEIDKESGIKSVNVYKISKNSTDAQLNEIKNNLQKNHNVKFEVSEVERNGSNELTSISVDIKKGKQTAKSLQSSDNKAINDFGVLIIDYKNGDTKIGIQTGDSSQKKESKITISNKLKTKKETNANIYSTTSTKTNSVTSTTVNTVVNTNTDVKTNPNVIITSNPTIVVSNSKKGKLVDQLVIIDGEEMPSDFDLNSINSKDIESMNVYTGVNAVAKYGEKGTHGAIEIKTKR